MRKKAFNIAKNPTYDGYQRGEVLLQWFINLLIKQLLAVVFWNQIIVNKELTAELQKLIIRNFKKRNVHSTFIDNIWGADVPDMHLIIKINKGFRFLLCVIDIYSKPAWVIPLKDKKRNFNC